MYDEDNLVMISALQHLLFCPRQCALIHIEQQWTENRLTAEGRILHERVQLCAQALCLEEMLNIEVPEGALYYGKKKRRVEIIFDQSLRETTSKTADKLHNLIANRTTPPPRYNPGCESCSFIETCLPKITGKKEKVAKYMENIVSS